MSVNQEDVISLSGRISDLRRQNPSGWTQGKEGRDAIDEMLIIPLSCIRNSRTFCDYAQSIAQALEQTGRFASGREQTDRDSRTEERMEELKAALRTAADYYADPQTPFRASEAIDCSRLVNAFGKDKASAPCRIALAQLAKGIAVLDKDSRFQPRQLGDMINTLGDLAAGRKADDPFLRAVARLAAEIAGMDKEKIVDSFNGIHTNKARLPAGEAALRRPARAFSAMGHGEMNEFTAQTVSLLLNGLGSIARLPVGEAALRKLAGVVSALSNDKIATFNHRDVGLSLNGLSSIARFPVGEAALRKLARAVCAMDDDKMAMFTAQSISLSLNGLDNIAQLAEGEAALRKLAGALCAMDDGRIATFTPQNIGLSLNGLSHIARLAEGEAALLRLAGAVSAMDDGKMATFTAQNVGLSLNGLNHIAHLAEGEAALRRLAQAICAMDDGKNATFTAQHVGLSLNGLRVIAHLAVGEAALRRLAGAVSAMDDGKIATFTSQNLSLSLNGLRAIAHLPNGEAALLKLAKAVSDMDDGKIATFIAQDISLSLNSLGLIAHVPEGEAALLKLAQAVCAMDDDKIATFTAQNVGCVLGGLSRAIGSDEHGGQFRRTMMSIMNAVDLEPLVESDQVAVCWICNALGRLAAWALHAETADAYEAGHCAQQGLRDIGTWLAEHPEEIAEFGLRPIGMVLVAFDRAQLLEETARIGSHCLQRLRALVKADGLRTEDLEALGQTCLALHPMLATATLRHLRADALTLLTGANAAGEHLQSIVARKLGLYLESRRRQQDGTLALHADMPEGEAHGMRYPAYTLYQVVKTYAQAVAQLSNRKLFGQEQRHKAVQRVKPWLHKVYEDVESLITDDMSLASLNLIAQMDAGQHGQSNAILDELLVRRLQEEMTGPCTQFDHEAVFAGMDHEPRMPENGAGLTPIQYYAFNGKPLLRDGVPREETDRYSLWGRFTGQPIRYVEMLRRGMSYFLMQRVIYLQDGSDTVPSRIDVLGGSKMKGDPLSINDVAQRALDGTAVRNPGYMVAVPLEDTRENTPLTRLLHALFPFREGTLKKAKIADAGAPGVKTVQRLLDTRITFQYGMVHSHKTREGEMILQMAKGTAMVLGPEDWKPEWEGIDFVMSANDIKSASNWTQAKLRATEDETYEAVGALMVTECWSPGSAVAVNAGLQASLGGDFDGDAAFLLRGLPRLMQHVGAEDEKQQREDEELAQKSTGQAFKPVKTHNPASNGHGRHLHGRADLILAARKPLLGEASTAQYGFTALPLEAQRRVAEEVVFKVYEGMPRAAMDLLGRLLKADGDAAQGSHRARNERKAGELDRLDGQLTAYRGEAVPEMAAAAGTLQAWLPRWARHAQVPWSKAETGAADARQLDAIEQELDALLETLPRQLLDKSPARSQSYVPGDALTTMKRLQTEIIKRGTDAFKAPYGLEAYEEATRVINRVMARQGGSTRPPYMKWFAGELAKGSVNLQPLREQLDGIPNLAAQVMKSGLDAAQESGVLEQMQVRQAKQANERAALSPRSAAVAHPADTAAPEDGAQAEARAAPATGKRKRQRPVPQTDAGRKRSRPAPADREALRKEAATWLDFVRQHEASITMQMSGMTDRIGGTLADLDKRIKTQEELADKWQRRSKSLKNIAARDRKDALRYTLILAEGEFLEQTGKLLQEMKEREWSVAAVSNFFSRNAPTYKGLHLTVNARAQAVVFEVQLHTPASHQAKAGNSAHYRQAKAATGQEKKRLDDKMRARIAAVGTPAGVEAIDLAWVAGLMEPAPAKKVGITVFDEAAGSRTVPGYEIDVPEGSLLCFTLPLKGGPPYHEAQQLTRCGQHVFNMLNWRITQDASQLVSNAVLQERLGALLAARKATDTEKNRRLTRMEFMDLAELDPERLRYVPARLDGHGMASRLSGPDALDIAPELDRQQAVGVTYRHLLDNGGTNSATDDHNVMIARDGDARFRVYDPQKHMPEVLDAESLSGALRLFVERYASVDQVDLLVPRTQAAAGDKEAHSGVPGQAQPRRAGKRPRAEDFFEPPAARRAAGPGQGGEMRQAGITQTQPERARTETAGWLETVRMHEPSITKELAAIAGSAKGRLQDMHMEFDPEKQLRRQRGEGEADGNVRKGALRYTVVWTDADFVGGAEAMLGEMGGRGWSVEAVGNFFREREADNKGIHLMVAYSRDGVVFEIQLHTQQSHDAKQANDADFHEWKSSKSGTWEQLSARVKQRTADVGHPRDVEKIGYRWAASVLRNAAPGSSGEAGGDGRTTKPAADEPKVPSKPPAQNQAARFLKMLEKSRR